MRAPRLEDLSADDFDYLKREKPVLYDELISSSQEEAGELFRKALAEMTVEQVRDLVYEAHLLGAKNIGKPMCNFFIKDIGRYCNSRAVKGTTRCVWHT